MSEETVSYAKITVKDASLLYDSIKAASAVTDEVPVKVTPDGISLRALDLSEVSMVDITIPPAATAEFKVDKPDTYVVKAAEMMKFLRLVGNDAVSLDFRRGTLVMASEAEVMRKADLAVFKPEGRELPLPKISYTSNFKADIKYLRQIVDLGKGVTDRIELSVVGKDLKLIARSEEKRSLEVTLMHEKGSLGDSTLEDGVSSRYDIGRLSLLIASFQPKAEVTFYFGKDLPLKIVAEVREGVILNYYLASLMES